MSRPLPKTGRLRRLRSLGFTRRRRQEPDILPPVIEDTADGIAKDVPLSQPPGISELCGVGVITLPIGRYELPAEEFESSAGPLGVEAGDGYAGCRSLDRGLSDRRPARVEALEQSGGQYMSEHIGDLRFESYVHAAPTLATLPNTTSSSEQRYIPYRPPPSSHSNESIPPAYTALPTQRPPLPPPRPPLSDNLPVSASHSRPEYGDLNPPYPSTPPLSPLSMPVSTAYSNAIPFVSRTNPTINRSKQLGVGDVTFIILCLSQTSMADAHERMWASALSDILFNSTDRSPITSLTLPQQLQSIRSALRKRWPVIEALRRVAEDVTKRVCLRLKIQVEEIWRMGQWTQAKAITGCLESIQAHVAATAVGEPDKDDPDSDLDSDEWENDYDSDSELETLDQHQRLDPNSDESDEELIKVLSTSFPKWLAWRTWSPDIVRLTNWETMDSSARDALKEVMALEGPDLDGEKVCETMRHGLVENFEQYALEKSENATGEENDSGNERLTLGVFHVQGLDVVGGPRKLLDMLLEVLDAVIRVAPACLKLFQQLTAHKVLDGRVLQALLIACELGRTEICKSLLEIVCTEVTGERVKIVRSLLPRLSDKESSTMRELAGPILAVTIDEELQSLQAKTSECIRDNRNLNLSAGRTLDFSERLNKAAWLIGHLSDCNRSFIRQLPSRDELKVLPELRTALIREKSPFAENINLYCSARLAGKALPAKETEIIAALLKIWSRPLERDRRELAFKIVTESSIPLEIQAECVCEVATTPQRLIKALTRIIGPITDVRCVQFARILVEHEVWVNKDGTAGSGECWHLLFRWMAEARHDKLGSDIGSIDEWFSWINNRQTLLELWEKNGKESGSEIATLKEGSRVSAWANELATRHIRALRRLQEVVKPGLHMNTIFVAAEDGPALYVPGLELIDPDRKHPLESVIIALLTSVVQNKVALKAAFEALRELRTTTPKVGRLCSRLLDIKQETGVAVAECFATGWYSRGGLSTDEKTALKAVAGIFFLSTKLSKATIRERLSAIEASMDHRFSTLVAEVQELETIRRTLQIQDHERTVNLLERVGIHKPGGAAAFGDGVVPTALVNVVERVGENEYELFFPLTQLKPLERLAISLGDARGVVVRVSLRRVIAFCIHLYPVRISDTTASPSTHIQRHNYQKISDPISNSPFCSSRPNRLLYQLSRLLYFYFCQQPPLDTLSSAITSIYSFLTERLKNLSSYCLVCGKTNVRLWRSTPCQKACDDLYRYAPLSIRLNELTSDPAVVDLLLTAIWACATTPNMLSLLEDCPIKDASTLLTTLSRLPSTTTLSTLVSANLSVTLRNYCWLAEELLSWLLFSHRAFITTATGLFKIPNLPGIHQFLLANSSALVTSAFLRHVSTNVNTTARLVFHGTSLDRLYNILRNGLKVLSDTPFMRTAAMHGPGVYLADEPERSLWYAPPIRGSWAKSKLADVRVLLACELGGLVTGAGGLVTGAGITVVPEGEQGNYYVVSDESKIAVRYVFLFGPDAATPIRKDIERALEIAYRALSTY